MNLVGKTGGGEVSEDGRERWEGDGGERREGRKSSGCPTAAQ